jgi:hypothetical protein
MLTIGIYNAEAKRRELLAAVESSETITITQSRKLAGIKTSLKTVYTRHADEGDISHCARFICTLRYDALF